MPEAVICGLGVATPLGLGLAQTAANVRAGISAARETDLLDTAWRRITGCRLAPEHLAVRPEAGVPVREIEIAALAALAVGEARGAFTGGLPAFSCWPESADAARIARRIPGIRQVSAGTGRAGGIAALAAALAALAEHPVVLAIAGDSLLHPMPLGRLQAARRLRTIDESDGLVPGQAGVAVLVATPEAARAAGLRSVARIQGLGMASDPGTPENDEPCAGDGLSIAMQAALGDGEPVRAWWTTMTGERFFAPELAAAGIRTADRFAPGAPAHHAARCLGDTGAAAGLLALALAAADAPRPVLVSASSDDGARAAALLG